MTNNIYLEERKYKILSLSIAIIFSLIVFFMTTLLRVNIYSYKMPKEIKVHLVTNIPINKPIVHKTEQKRVEKRAIKHKMHKAVKHITPHPIQKPKPIEKPIVSKIPPPEPTKANQEPPKPQEHDIAKQTSVKPAEEASSSETSKTSTSPPVPKSSEKPTKNEIALYLSKVYEIIEAHKHYPSLAKRRGDSGTVFVRVSIAKSGNVNSVSLLNSSGSYILDEYTKELIEHLKFPPPPKGAITFDLKVHYRLDEGE